MSRIILEQTLNSKGQRSKSQGHEAPRQGMRYNFHVRHQTKPKLSWSYGVISDKHAKAEGQKSRSQEGHVVTVRLRVLSGLIYQERNNRESSNLSAASGTLIASLRSRGQS